MDHNATSDMQREWLGVASAVGHSAPTTARMPAVTLAALAAPIAVRSAEAAPASLATSSGTATLPYGAPNISTAVPAAVLQTGPSTTPATETSVTSASRLTSLRDAGSSEFLLSASSARPTTESHGFLFPVSPSILAVGSSQVSAAVPPKMTTDGPSGKATVGQLKVPAPGPSGTSISGMSATPAPGTSKISIIGPSAVPKVGPSMMSAVGLSKMPASDPSPTAGPSSMPVTGPSSMQVPGPSSMFMPGASSGSAAGPSSMPTVGTSRAAYEPWTRWSHVDLARPGRSAQSNVEHRDRSPIVDFEPRPGGRRWNQHSIALCSSREREHVAVKRILKELEDLKSTAPQGCTAAPKGDNLFEWTAIIEGPEDTVYKGGTFFVDISIPKTYPFSPPKVKFLTRIYHCNINWQGIVCVDILRRAWTASMTLTTVLQAIVTLMYVCNPADALVGAIADQYLTNRELFERTARIWTVRYAH